ncbi:MAG: Xaa-Pro peptidase family protein [Rikenellaceae bacterium]
MYRQIEEQELATRWGKAKEAMAQSGVEAMIISDNTSLCYLAGRIFGGVAYISLAEENPLFFVRRPVGLQGDNVAYIRKVEQIPSLLAERGYSQPKNIALEGDTYTYNDYMRTAKIFGLAPQNILPTATQIIRRARSRKTPYEIEQARYSGVMHSKLYDLIPSIFRVGMRDIDLAAELEYHARKLGSLGNMRIFGSTMEPLAGSILVGENADTPSPFDFALGGAGLDGSLPVGCNGTKIEGNMAIMVDQGGTFSRYMTDMTRVYSIGQLPDIAYRAHQLSIEIHEMLISRARVGVPTADIYNESIEMVNRASLSEYFMGYTQQVGFVGHGVGLEVNEGPVMAPRSREIFEEGNVIALEPKFVIPGVGAVGIENTYVITDSGIEKLTLHEEAIVALDA